MFRVQLTAWPQSYCHSLKWVASGHLRVNLRPTTIFPSCFDATSTSILTAQECADFDKHLEVDLSPGNFLICIFPVAGDLLSPCRKGDSISLASLAGQRPHWMISAVGVPSPARFQDRFK